MRRKLVRFLVAGLAVLALGGPSAGVAGTAADPEITDPAGDVQWIPEGDLSYLDLRAAWFDSVRGDEGSLDAFRLTIRNAAAPAEDQPMMLWATWDVAGDRACHGELNISDDARSIGDGELTVQWTADAWVYSWCDGDSNAVTLGPVTVVVLQDGRRAEFVRDGVDYIATIPLALFDGSSAEGLYGEGTVLSGTMVSTMKVLLAGAIGVDWNETSNPFTLGS